MKSNLIYNTSRDLSNKLYSGLNSYSQSNETLGRICSIPVSLLDIGIESFSLPLASIEFAAMAVIHLIGAAFSKEYTLRNALKYTESSLMLAAATPVKFALAPIKVVFQIFVILNDPKNVVSIERE